jgi:hypothetical protein
MYSAVERTPENRSSQEALAVALQKLISIKIYIQMPNKLDLI